MHTKQYKCIFIEKIALMQNLLLVEKESKGTKGTNGPWVKNILSKEKTKKAY